MNLLSSKTFENIIRWYIAEEEIVKVFARLLLLIFKLFPDMEKICREDFVVS